MLEIIIRKDRSLYLYKTLHVFLKLLAPILLRLLLVLLSHLAEFLQIEEIHTQQSLIVILSSVLELRGSDSPVI